MRLGFSEKLSSIEGSGKHKFLYRLSKCLQSMGIKIDRKHPDIYLILPGHDSKKGCKNILRLDGLIINKDMNLKKLRLGIDFEMEIQDGVSLDESDPKLKAMEESARQLGLDFKKR